MRAIIRAMEQISNLTAAISQQNAGLFYPGTCVCHCVGP